MAGQPPSFAPVRPPSLPLYLAGAAAQIAGLSAVANQVSEPLFGWFTILLTLIGAATAFILRGRGKTPPFLQVGIVAVGIVLMFALRGSGLFAGIIPLESQGSQEILLVSALALTATFCTFLWINDEAVAFSCVWSIAMIGLTGTVNINRELIIAFIFFLAAATFLLVHQNSLAQSGGASANPLQASNAESRGANRLLRTQGLMALLAWGGSLVLGFIVAIPVQMVGRNLSLNTIIQRLQVPPTPVKRGPARPRLSFDNLNSFVVGIGPVDDDPSERVQVLTEAPHYWRGRTFDQYTGKSWVSTLPTQGEDISPTEGGEGSSGFNKFVLPVIEKSRHKTQRVTHHFRIGSGIFGPLYHASEPRLARAPLYHVIQREDNTLSAGRGLGAEYEIDSDVADPSPGELRKSGTKYPQIVSERYLDKGPPSTALAELMQEATKGAATNPYDRMQAIRRFVANRCLYTREARAVPSDQDAAVFFLNESKEGYCDLYATSFTILCRYAGVPARVATGFAPGTPASADNTPPVPSGDKRQWYSLRGSDLHAWTEVYFNGFGWVAFDATQDTGGTVTPERTPEPIKKQVGWREIWAKNTFAIVCIGLGLAGMLFVVANEFLGRFTPRLALRSGKQFQSSNSVVMLYLKTVRKVERRGARRADTMTPAEYLRYLQKFAPTVAVAMEPLTQLTERALYGPDTLSEAEKAEADRASRAVNEALRKFRPTPAEKPTPSKGAASGANR